MKDENPTKVDQSLIELMCKCIDSVRLANLASMLALIVSIGALLAVLLL